MTDSITLKLSGRLKEQIAKLAEAEGKSLHAWMAEAIEAQAKQAGRRLAFYEEARQSVAEYEKTGVSYGAKDVHRYFLARALGKQARRPTPLLF